MTVYNKEVVDNWLSHVSEEFAMLIWLAATVTGETRSRDGHAGEFQSMNPWEQVNCLYGLKDKIVAHLDQVIAKYNAAARADDDANQEFAAGKMPLDKSK